MGFLHRLFRRRNRPEVWAAESQLLHRFGYAQPLEAVQWISTSACDLKCPHCYSHAGHRSAGELSTDEAKRLIIDELVALGSPTLVLAGGEALLRKDFAEIIRYAHERGVPWAVHTHGGHVPRHLDAIAAHPPIMAAISLDGPRAHHDAFRGKVGSFDAALDAMEKLVAIGVPEVVAGTTITRQNADLLFDMVPTVVRSAAHSWGFHLVTPEGRAHGNDDLLPTPRQLHRAASLARRLRDFVHVELDNEWGSAGDDDAFYRDDPFACGAGRFSCVVSATGELMPCTTTELAESAGNLRDTSLRTLWANGFAAFRTKGDPIRGACDDCWLQTRHGCSARSAFDPPLPPDLAPPMEVAR